MAITSAGHLDWATWDPISDRSTIQSGLVRMTIHTAVTSSPDIYGPGKGPGGTYAHAYSPLSGNFRQHQEVHHKAYADLDGNGSTFAVEHEDDAQIRGMNTNQLDHAARAFADLVLHSRSCSQCNVPNRIATIDNTHGLANHRLGIQGNFPPYNSHDKKTWTGKQSGANWSSSYGKLCATDPKIDQLDEIYSRAQAYIGGGNGGDDDMALTHVVRSRSTNQALGNTNDWQTIKVREDNDAPVKQLILGPAEIISGVVYLYATGLGNDGKIEARVYVVDDPDASGQPDERQRSGSIATMWALKGGVHGVLPFQWNMSGSGQAGVKRRLQLEVRADSDAAVIEGVRTEMWVKD